MQALITVVNSNIDVNNNIKPMTALFMSKNKVCESK